MLQSNPAYFQIERNEEFILETKKDYIEMGKRAYESAEEYFRIIEKYLKK